MYAQLVICVFHTTIFKLSHWQGEQGRPGLRGSIGPIGYDGEDVSSTITVKSRTILVQEHEFERHNTSCLSLCRVSLVHLD